MGWKAPKIKKPEIKKPKISAPKISAPKISAPKISAPKISAPKISAPKPLANLGKKIKPIAKELAPLKKISKPATSIQDLRNKLNPITPVKAVNNATAKVLTGKNVKELMQSTGVAKPVSNTMEKAVEVPKAAQPIPGAQPPQPAKPPVPQQPAAPNPNDLNHWGIPRPTRFETIDPTTGKLKNQFQLDYMSKREQSPWAQMMQDNMTRQYNTASADILNQSMAGAQTGMNSLARQGGLTGGNRVALMQNANRDAIMGRQNLANKYQDSMAGISTDDITRQLNTDQYNIGNNMGQIDKDFGAKFDVYSEMLKKHSSDYMADKLGAMNEAERAEANRDASLGKFATKTGQWGNPGGLREKLDPLLGGAADPFSKNFGKWG